MDDLLGWLLRHAKRNARTVFNTIIDDYETNYFGHSSPENWINSLSNVELMAYNRQKENEK